MKTRISAPAHPSATGIGRVSGLVKMLRLLYKRYGRPGTEDAMIREKSFVQTWPWGEIGDSTDLSGEKIDESVFERYLESM